MQYISYFISAIFLYLNYKIVVSDFKYKIIPNKFLGYLLLLIPFYYTYLFFYFPEINYILFLGQIIITFLISFILYYFGVWAAGDAKYLLVLALFIPYIGIIPFIGNIALVTILYLLLYFLYFYLGKLILNKKYRKDLFRSIKQDLYETWETYRLNKGEKTLFIILKWIVVFLIIFTSIRLSRIYLIDSLIEEGNNINLISEIIEKYNIYIIFGLIGAFILGLYLFILIANKVKNYISEKLNISIEKISNIFISILTIILTSFIILEYTKDKEEIINLLIKIFTIYLLIYIIFKILLYSYKITFGIAETDYINIKNLEKGNIVDKEYLIKMFGEQYILGYYKETFKRYNKNGILFPSPKEYFTKVDNPITKETSEKIKKVFEAVNNYHNKNSDNYEENNLVKIINTFSFGPYIFLGFVLVFLFQDEIFKYIVNLLLNFMKTFY